MIVSAILIAVAALVSAISVVLPSAPSVAGIQSGIAAISGAFWSMLGVVSPVLDLGVLEVICVLWAWLVVVGVGFRIANFAFNHLPLIGAFG